MIVNCVDEQISDATNSNSTGRQRPRRRASIKPVPVVVSSSESESANDSEHSSPCKRRRARSSHGSSKSDDSEYDDEPLKKMLRCESPPFPDKPAVIPKKGEYIVVDCVYSDSVGIGVGKVISVDEDQQTCQYRNYSSSVLSNMKTAIGARFTPLAGKKNISTDSFWSLIAVFPNLTQSKLLPKGVKDTVKLHSIFKKLSDPPRRVSSLTSIVCG